MENRYELIAGKHHQDDITYKKGDVITTSIELDKVFQNKFKNLGPVPVPQFQRPPELVTSRPAVTVPIPPDPAPVTKTVAKAATTKAHAAKKKSGEEWNE